MKRACDVTVHIFHFKQLDTFCEASFKLRVSTVTGLVNEGSTGEPYLLPNNSQSTLENQFFVTPVFSPEALTSFDLNEMCTFRVEIPADLYPDPQRPNKVQTKMSNKTKKARQTVERRKSYTDFESRDLDGTEIQTEVRIIVDLLMFGLQDTSFGKTYPPDKEGYSHVGRNVLKVTNAWKGVHEFTETNFHDVLFCSASLAVHTSLINLAFDIRLLPRSLQSKISYF